MVIIIIEGMPCLIFDDMYYESKKGFIELQQEKWRDNFSDILDELKRLFEL